MWDNRKRSNECAVLHDNVMAVRKKYYWQSKYGSEVFWIEKINLLISDGWQKKIYFVLPLCKVKTLHRANYYVSTHSKIPSGHIIKLLVLKEKK